MSTTFTALIKFLLQWNKAKHPFLQLSMATIRDHHYKTACEILSDALAVSMAKRENVPLYIAVRVTVRSLGIRKS